MHFYTVADYFEIESYIIELGFDTSFCTFD